MSVSTPFQPTKNHSASATKPTRNANPCTSCKGLKRRCEGSAPEICPYCRDHGYLCEYLKFTQINIILVNPGVESEKHVDTISLRNQEDKLAMNDPISECITESPLADQMLQEKLADAKEIIQSAFSNADVEIVESPQEYAGLSADVPIPAGGIPSVPSSTSMPQNVSLVIDCSQVSDAASLDVVKNNIREAVTD